ncbi:MAG: DUF5916 domain-containing protein [Pedobacter sp.]|nr:DUF5916 domain-containing protein [Pedobacter sp.]MDQ8052592.1 DUF5916 domain-containing protein [Pedobacter sp.]
MKLTLTTLLLTLGMACAFAQNGKPKKIVRAQRTAASPKIDGVLDDEVWNGVPIATDFIELRPVPGRLETRDGRTEVKIIYDDYAVYISARMFDKPDSVVHELVSRDQIGNADFLGVVFDTFLDGVNGYGFFVTAAGVQFDAKYSLIGGEDPSWNAVWESSVKLDDQGWTAEMKIPYSALRFSSKEIQNWGFNITRKRTGTNRQTFWNFVDPKVDGFINQSGVLEGLKNIKAPLRLSFSPYVSTLISHYPYNTPGVKNTQTSINGGMDLKYGINQSFTLDMTLIPDFGQVQSDYRVLNLTPFEVKFNENRQFFTEGTELFNKGDLFYSKRIGSIPSYFDRSGLKAGDKVIKDPQEGKVLNATKISGRTAGGLGIGVFNAVTNKMYTEVEDASGNRRAFESQPLTNYNIFVLDQSLKNNSSISVINTNVLRQGSAYDANVSAALFNINDKKNRYYVDGAGKMSYVTAEPIKDARYGYSYTFSTGKKSGTFTFEYEQEFADTHFDPSDMGFYTNNNFFDQSLEFGYNVFKPSKWYNSIEAWLYVEYSRRFKPGDFQNFRISPGAEIQFKNLWSMDIETDYGAKGNDFYESRSGGIYQTPQFYRFAVYVNSNRAKRYNYGGNFKMIQYPDLHGAEYNYYIYQNLRINDRLSFGLDLNFNPNYNAVNWVGFNGSQAIFSSYDRNTVENTLDAKYSFSNKMGIQLGVRHYWSDRRNKDFYVLNTDGTLSSYSGTALSNVDRNYNVFNIDLSYVWQFTPGSELSITYKDAAETNEQFLTRRYDRNFNKVLSGPQNNSLSIKVLYYIDYLNLKKKKSK